jgi:hypoxanthine phosphoribosyltransferase
MGEASGQGSARHHPWPRAAVNSSRGRHPWAESIHYTAGVLADVDKVLIEADRIAARVRDLGLQITADLDRLGAGNLRDGGVVLVPILTGSIIFLADLVRHLPYKLRIEVLTVSSYPGRATASVGPRLTGALPADLTGRHVIIVDDILDSGRTIRLVRDEIASRGPATIRSCVLVRKLIPSALGTPCEYVGFDIPDEFVVGYGLDYDNYYRNLPSICTLRREAMA